ncbi:MAG TPA: ABC transporter ATP-binding protein [Candidatus Dormibacteraeota bacterium]|nr:ABC transporter ATP-binding protein [Candidatus Dormibacteraeota bacterium]
MLEVRGLRRDFAGAPAIAGLDLCVERGELVCVVGPSGCGKTTLLRCLAGLLPATGGEVLLRGRRIDRPPPEMALVFQDYGRSLFPWMSVRDNVALPLRRKRLDRAARDGLIDGSLAAVGLDGAGDRYPWQLSGGMQQRAAIARALAYEPEILLLDEPFASVDAQTRADLEDLLLRVWTASGLTAVLVTHDVDEAVYLADRVLVLSGGPATLLEVVPVGLPRPRDQVDTRDLHEFAVLRGHLYRRLRGRAEAQR